MNWGSGGDRGQGPWGSHSGKGGGKPPRGPNFDDIRDRFNRMQKGFHPRGMRPGGFLGWGAVGLGLLVLFVLWAGSGIYIVEAGSQGVVTRFGKFNHVTGPGLHYHLPFPIDKVVSVPVEEQKREEIGSGTGASARSEIITGDESFIDIDFTITWRVDDPANFLFNILGPELTIRAIGESTMREVVGALNFHEIIGVGPELDGGENSTLRAQAEIERNVSESLQETLDSLSAGVQIRQVNITKILPPETVIPSVNAVQIAQSEARRLENAATAEVNRRIPIARGEAEERVGKARGELARSVSEARGQAARFTALLEEYEKAPEVVYARLYTETMVGIFNATNTTLIDDALSGTILVPYGTGASSLAPIIDTRSAQERGN